MASSLSQSVSLLLATRRPAGELMISCFRSYVITGTSTNSVLISIHLQEQFVARALSGFFLGREALQAIATLQKHIEVFYSKICSF